MKLHNRFTAACLICLALVLPVQGCATYGVNRRQINIFSPQEDAQLGQQIESEIAKQYKEYPDVEIAGYISSVGQRLAVNTTGPQFSYKFTVIAQDQLNAFSIPGGHVYIFTGLLKTFSNEAELAAVLGHEIGHVAARHATSRLTVMYGYDLLASIIIGRNPSYGISITKDILGTLTSLQYSREDELQADQIGIQLMVSAGYDPRGMIQLLQELQKLEKSKPSAALEILRTHPHTDIRLRDAENFISTNYPLAEGALGEQAYKRDVLDEFEKH